MSFLFPILVAVGVVFLCLAIDDWCYHRKLVARWRAERDAVYALVEEPGEYPYWIPLDDYCKARFVNAEQHAEAMLALRNLRDGFLQFACNNCYPLPYPDNGGVKRNLMQAADKVLANTPYGK